MCRCPLACLCEGRVMMLCTKGVRGFLLQALRSVSWHHEGKQFMCSHTDGSLTTYNIKQPQKPVSVMMPHGECCGHVVIAKSWLYIVVHNHCHHDDTWWVFRTFYNQSIKTVVWNLNGLVMIINTVQVKQVLGNLSETRCH